METRYPFQKEEAKIYQLWEKSGYFNPDNLSAKKGAKPRNTTSAISIKTSPQATAEVDIRGKPFCIIMPPANANGSLHLGHAVFVTLQDIMIRFHRMKGDKTLWLPGADHAGFETQVVYDKKLEKEGRNRFKIPRGQLYKEILKFTLKNKKVMENQLRKLGASCDWSREKFTLDDDIVKIVYQTFEKLKSDGLLYQGQRIVNWCPKHQTSLSDLEVKYIEREDPFYYIKYGPLELGTVRLETKFGDTAVAVNPKDKRYQKYIGQEIEIETLIGKRKIKVISDQAVDMDFGTGVVKVTPAHDADDFEIWQRHKSEMPSPIQVIDKFGRLTSQAGPYKGLKVLEARKKIAQDMAKRGLLDPSKTDEHYKHNVAVCYKCGWLIEPMILDNQWFIKMTAKPKSGKFSLRDLAIKAVKDGKIKFVPKHFEKIFFHWMKNLKDWNISRQIPWGIKIPEKNSQDVLDTWFSSGQWPFATLMTTRPNDFEKFYPTDVMETAWDILFFWVARMIMLGIYVTGKVPFKYVYLHGLVRDKDRQKMSKSKGNVIDPLGVINLYGADSLRMALVFGTASGSDIIVSEEKIITQQRFVTKIWNASRFIFQNLDKNFKPEKIRAKDLQLTKEDKWILKELKKAVIKTTEEIDNFRFHQAAQTIYHFFWHKFCDQCLEDVKKRLYSKNTTSTEKKTAQWIVYTVLVNSLKLLHPFMPFVSESIYQKLPYRPKKALIIDAWPK